jgi:D-aminoacyl-tRNA deacylase
VRVLVQRVSQARVSVADQCLGEIGPGLVLLVGCQADDDDSALRFCAEKCVNLRIFADDAGKMNRSLLETGGEALAISQFTLYGDCRRGRRPSFTGAAPPETAEPIYQRFLACVSRLGPRVVDGRFGAHMLVEIHNDGPVTLMVESP